MRARSNGVDTRIADLFSLTVTSQKKNDRQREREPKKKRRWSARAEQHADSLIGGGTAGAADADSVTTTTTQHTITGGLELERGKPTWPGLGLVCGLELEQALTYNNGNTGRFGVGMTFLARMDCV